VLVEMTGEQYRTDLYNIGLAVNFAFSDPKQLAKFLKPKTVTSEDVTAGPVRLPKDRTKRTSPRA
jgi:hypothetical protein